MNFSLNIGRQYAFKNSLTLFAQQSVDTMVIYTNRLYTLWFIWNTLGVTITENAVLANDEEDAFGNGFDGRP